MVFAVRAMVVGLFSSNLGARAERAVLLLNPARVASVMTARWLAPLLVFAAFSLGGATIAQASCIAPPPLKDELSAAPVVFVGMVVSTSDGGRRARVRVESIWKGGSMPSYVDVSGSQASGPTTATSIDRTFESGRRYLFVPFNDRPPFQDNNCSATQPYTVGVAGYAPSDARAPNPYTLADWAQNLLGQGWQELGIIGIVVVVTGAVVAVWRRRVLANMRRRASPGK